MTDSKPTLQKVLGVAHFSAITLPPSQFVRCAAKAGFNAVGLRLHPAFPGAPYYELPKGSKSAAEFRALLDSEGMSVFDIEFFVIDPQFDAAAVEAIVAAAADIGARRLSACGDDADRQRLVDNLGSFCTVAARHGMAVDLENMGWRTVSTYRQSATIINDCAQTNAGVLVDAIHFFRNGGNVNEIDRNIVRHVQLCDVSGAAPATPEGMINEARSAVSPRARVSCPCTTSSLPLRMGQPFQLKCPWSEPPMPRSICEISISRLEDFCGLSNEGAGVSGTRFPRASTACLFVAGRQEQAIAPMGCIRLLPLFWSLHG